MGDCICARRYRRQLAAAGGAADHRGHVDPGRSSGWAGLRFSGFGRWFLGRLWPGQFADGKQKRLATNLALVLLLAYVGWGMGTLLGSLTRASALVEQIESTLTVLGMLGACGIVWAQVVLARRGA